MLSVWYRRGQVPGSAFFAPMWIVLFSVLFSVLDLIGWKGIVCFCRSREWQWGDPGPGGHQHTLDTGLGHQETVIPLLGLYPSQNVLPWKLFTMVIRCHMKGVCTICPCTGKSYCSPLVHIPLTFFRQFDGISMDVWPPAVFKAFCSPLAVVVALRKCGQHWSLFPLELRQVKIQMITTTLVSCMSLFPHHCRRTLQQETGDSSAIFT